MTVTRDAHSSAVTARILLVRHGQTAANTGKVWHGSTDTPLSDHGRGQALRVAAHLADSCPGAAALYASPLERARHTASAIGDALELDTRIHAGLSEYDLGDWEGMSYESLARDKDLWTHIRNDPDFAPHGGESPRGATDRFCEALREIAALHPGQPIIAVAHGGVMALALGFLLKGEHGRWQGVMNNCAVSELILEPKPHLIRFNEVTHLDDGAGNATLR